MTAVGPSSAPQQAQTAPMLVVPNIAMAASVIFGRQPATRSPGRTPISRNQSATRPTSLRSAEYVKRDDGPFSSLEMKATPSLYLSRFSAKFNRASWNHLAPGNLVRSSTTFSYFRDDRIPEYCHTADQKSGIFSTDHLYSSGYDRIRRLYDSLTMCMN